CERGGTGAGAVDAPLAALARRPTLAAGVWDRGPRRGGPGHGEVRSGCESPRVHARTGLLRALGLRRPVAGARAGGVQWHPHDRATSRAQLRGVGRRPRSGQTVAFLRFEEAVQEISAVQVLPGKRYPDVIHDELKWLAESFVLPDEALAETVPAL